MHISIPLWIIEKNASFPYFEHWGVRMDSCWHISKFYHHHNDDVIMTMLESQITSLTVVYSIVYSGVHQRKHQSSASLAFVREIHRGPVNFPHKWPVTRKMFPFDDVIMILPRAYTIPMWVSWICLRGVSTHASHSVCFSHQVNVLVFFVFMFPWRFSKVLSISSVVKLTR